MKAQNPKILVTGFALAILCFFAALSEAGSSNKFLLRFEEADYAVSAANVFTANIVVDPVPEQKLFSCSFGVRITNSDGVVGVGKITLVPAYNFNGPLGDGAVAAESQGMPTIQGTSNFFVAALPKLKNNVIGTLNLGALPTGHYSMELVPFSPLGSHEQLFVTGNLKVADAKIIYNSATLEVKDSDSTPTPSASPNVSISTNAVAEQRPRSPRSPTQWMSQPAKVTSKPLSDADLTVEVYSYGNVVVFQSETGQIYHIEYSSDSVRWKIAEPPLMGTGGLIEWTDLGPPFTDSLPTEFRFYRAVVDTEASE